MKRTVTVTLVIDTDDYDEDLVTPTDVVDLAFAMLLGHADLPDEVKVACEHSDQTLADYLARPRES